MNLQDILEKHVKWLNGDPTGKRANLTGANLTGANLSGRTPLLADTARGYVLYVIPEAKEPVFIAGCRTFTYGQAIAHWGEGSERAQPAYIAAIERWKGSA